MYQFFLVCFLVGVIFTVISFLIGHLFEVFGIDGLDFDLHLLGLEFFLPLSPMLVMLFMTIFGGMGLILMKLTQHIPIILIIFLSFVIAFLASFIVYKCIIKPLRKAQNTSAAEADELIGIRATVSGKIPKNGFGEITYQIRGNSYVAPAKATSEVEIVAGSHVVICWIKDYVFYVANIDI